MVVGKYGFSILNVVRLMVDTRFVLSFSGQCVDWLPSELTFVTNNDIRFPSTCYFNSPFDALLQFVKFTDVKTDGFKFCILFFFLFHGDVSGAVLSMSILRH